MTAEQELQHQRELNRKLQSRLRGLTTLVKNTRKAQRDYFAQRGNDALKKEMLKVSKQHEQQLDDTVKQLEFEKLV